MFASRTGRALALTGLLALALAACGRKGALEAPPDLSAPKPPGQTQRSSGGRGSPADGPATQGRGSVANAQATQASANRAQLGAAPAADEEDEIGAELGALPGFFSQPSQTNSPLRRRPYKVPKEPFILDPLL